MKESITGHGFGLVEFVDANGVKCTVQESSSMDDSKIWLGVHAAEVKAGPPWRDVELPADVLVSSRMHLNQEQVRALLPILTRFAETGSLGEPELLTSTYAQGWAICGACGHRGQHVVEELPDVPMLGGMECPKCGAAACAWELPRHLWPKGYSEDREAAKLDAAVLPMKPGPQMAAMFAADPLPPLVPKTVPILPAPALPAVGELVTWFDWFNRVAVAHAVVVAIEGTDRVRIRADLTNGAKRWFVASSGEVYMCGAYNLARGHQPLGDEIEAGTEVQA